LKSLDSKKQTLANASYFTRACLQLIENGSESDAEQFVFRTGGGFPNQQMSDS